MSQPSIENLAALLGSRICHDLISPIGAVNNGIELLSLSGIPDSPELFLVAESAANASARISLFRLAFGMASADQNTRQDEICRIWPAAMAGRRLDLNWHGPASLPRRQAQVVVLGLLCLDKALPQGGAIGVSEANGAWILTATAPVVKTDPDLWETLYTFDREVTDPAYVQFLLMPYYLDRLNRSCTVDIKEDSVTLTL